MFSEIKIYPENNGDVLGIVIYKQLLERSLLLKINIPILLEKLMPKQW